MTRRISTIPPSSEGIKLGQRPGIPAKGSEPARELALFRKQVGAQGTGGTSALRNWKVSHQPWQRALNTREGLTTLGGSTSIFR